MNTRQIPPGGGKPVAKPVSGKPLSSKPLSGKPRDQDKGIPRKTVAEATGAPKREEAMAASYVHAIASDSAPYMLSAAFERIERLVQGGGTRHGRRQPQAHRHRARTRRVKLRSRQGPR